MGKSALCMLLVLLGLSAQDTYAQNQPINAQESWARNQKVLRQVMQVTDLKPYPVVLDWERTPLGHHKIMVARTKSAITMFFWLQAHHNTIVVEDSKQYYPVAPWMFGYRLFGEMLEPSMLQAWSLGFPGVSPFVGAEKPQIITKDGLPSRILQDGWSVHYRAWRPATNTSPSLPHHMTLCRESVCLNIETKVEGSWAQIPDGYEGNLVEE